MKFRIYVKNKFNTVQENMSYKFQNAIQKERNNYWITSQSKIAYTSLVETDAELEQQVPCLHEDIPEEGIQRSLQQAINTPAKSVVVGKVVKVSPLRCRRERFLTVRSLIIRDGQTVAKLCLFAQNAEIPVQLQDVVKVKSVYSKRYNNNIQLIATPVSQFQFVAPNEKINTEDVDLSVYENDPDFNEDINEGVPEEVTLTDFLDVDVYECCDEACRKKRIKNENCPVCLKQQQNAVKTFKVTFLMATQKIRDKEIVLFQNSIERVIGEC